MHFITVECDIATLTLSNGEIHTYDYYEGDELLYSYCFVVECNYSVMEEIIYSTHVMMVILRLQILSVHSLVTGHMTLVVQEIKMVSYF